MRMRMLPVSWMALLATAGVAAGSVQAGSAAEARVVASPARTIEWPASHVAPEAGAPEAGAPEAGAPEAGATPHGAVVAQSQITAGPLQGPLNAQGTIGQGSRCSVPLRRVAHRRRVARRAPPVLVAALPVVPFVPAYAYPPPVVYRPVVPVYAFRPFYRPYFYRPYFYRPFFYRGFY